MCASIYMSQRKTIIPVSQLLPENKKYRKPPGLPDLLGLQSDRLSVNEDTLALIRLRSSPFPNLCRKLRHRVFIDALQQDTCGLWSARLDAFGDAQLDGVRETDFQVNKLLAWICRLDSGCGGFDAGPVTDTNQTQNTDVAFRDA